MSKYKVGGKKLPKAGCRGGSIYPWHDMGLNEGVDNWFNIPARDISSKCANYSPNPPTSLVSDGFKISVRKQTDGSLDVFRVA